jgi:hypothetical protein
MRFSRVAARPRPMLHSAKEMRRVQAKLGGHGLTFVIAASAIGPKPESPGNLSPCLRLI